MKDAATKIWKHCWGLLFILAMTLLSELSTPQSGTAALTPPHLFSAKQVAEAPQPAPMNPHWHR